MKKVLVFGSQGMIGSRFIELNQGNFVITAPEYPGLDVCDGVQLEKAIKESTAETVINFAAATNVDGCEAEKGDKNGGVYRLNALMVKNLAGLCKDAGKHLVHLSTSYVFTGDQREKPYCEEDSRAPVNWYGQTKYEGELFLEESGCDYTMIRIDWPFSSFYEIKKDTARFFLEQLRSGCEVIAVTDQKITPVYNDTISKVLSQMIEKKITGTFHVGTKKAVSPFSFAVSIAEAFGFDRDLVKPIAFAEFNKDRKASRPQYPWMDSAKISQELGENTLPDVEESLQLFKSNLPNQYLQGQ